MPSHRAMPGPNKKLLVVAAWKPELARLHQLVRTTRMSGLVTRILGVGLVEAAAGAARAFEEERPDEVVLVGTAGVFAGCALAPPQAVWAKELALGVPEPQRDAELPPPMPREVVPAPRLGRNIATAAALPGARVVCPLAITRSRSRARRLSEANHAQLENLEAFAVARAAAGAKVRFAVVLGIANTVGPNGQAEWRKNGDAAAAAACDAVWSWLVRGRRGA